MALMSTSVAQNYRASYMIDPTINKTLSIANLKRTNLLNILLQSNSQTLHTAFRQQQTISVYLATGKLASFDIALDHWRYSTAGMQLIWKVLICISDLGKLHTDTSAARWRSKDTCCTRGWVIFVRVTCVCWRRRHSSSNVSQINEHKAWLKAFLTVYAVNLRHLCM